MTCTEAGPYFPASAGPSSNERPAGPGVPAGPGNSSGMSNADFNRMWAPAFDFAKRYRMLLLVAVPVAVGLWATKLSTMPSLQGQPGHDQAGYYLYDHGSGMPVSRAGYERALAAQDRLFADGATLFLVVAGVMTVYRPRPHPKGTPNA